jgi:hypothetical protein
MTTIQSEVFEAFRDMGVAEDKAVKAAAALSKRDDDVVSLKADVNLIKWMVGFMLAMVVALFLKQFIH